MAKIKLNRLAPYPYNGLVLLPGVNRVSDDYVEDMLKNPNIADEFERKVFELVDESEEAAEPVSITAPELPDLPEKAFDDMTVPEIEAAAAKRGIDLGDAKNKADKLAALKAGAEQAAE